MRVLDLGHAQCARAQGDFGEARRGIVYPGEIEKLKGHVHNGWHITVIRRGVGIIRTPTNSFRVSEGDAIEIAPHEVHELEALFGPIEYFCIGIKGF